MENGAEIAVSLQPVEKKRASEMIYDQIRKMILSGELRPGDRLPSERHLMDRLKRSRPTIREALRMLEREGFIHTIAGSNGAVVQQVSPQQVERGINALLKTDTITLHQLAEMRLAVESEAVAWAAKRCTPEDLEYIGGLVDEMERCIEDKAQFVALDLKFHGAVARASQNQAAYIIVRVLRESVKTELNQAENTCSPMGTLTMNRKISYMHRCIYNALVQHDPVAAKQAMQLHLQAFLNDLSHERKDGEE